MPASLDFTRSMELSFHLKITSLMNDLATQMSYYGP